MTINELFKKLTQELVHSPTSIQICRAAGSILEEIPLSEPTRTLRDSIPDSLFALEGRKKESKLRKFIVISA